MTSSQRLYICNLRLGLLLFFSFPFFAKAYDLSEPKKSKSPEVIFEGMPQEVQEMGRKIITTSVERFEKITGKTVGNLPIRICISDELPSKGSNRLGVEIYQGVMRPQQDHCVIEISKDRTWSLGRILTHEVTHVFIREAYGTSLNLNKTLNEGLAEYMASQEFPSEVRQYIRAVEQSKFIGDDVRPYIEGYRFCSTYAEEKRFPEFFSTHIRKPDLSYSQLKEAWKKDASEAKE